MKADDLTCTKCNAKLNTAFLGKAEARDWDPERLTCDRHSFDGARVLPEA